MKSNNNTEWSVKIENRNLRAKVRSLEKENKRLRKEVKNLEHRVDDFGDEPEDDELEPVHVDQEKPNKCPLCEAPLMKFTIESPAGPLFFEKCNICSHRKRLKSE